MATLKNGDKVQLNVAGMIFKRTVLAVEGFAIYLVEGGDAFDSRTGKVWGSTSSAKTISHA